LTAAQGLVRHPRLLMLDEPSAGLSPVLVDRVLNVIAKLRTQGAAVLLVQQLLEKVLASTASTRWCRCTSCWKRQPTRTTCCNGSSAPVSDTRA